MTVENRGGCVCGQLRYVAIGEPSRVTVCHCEWCQRRTGSAFGIEVVFERRQISTLSGSVSTYRHLSDESGRWLDQAFCPRCGTNIGFTLEAVPEVRTIAAGTFDDPSWIRADTYLFRHVYTRSARTWSEIPEGVESYEAHFRS